MKNKVKIQIRYCSQFDFIRLKIIISMSILKRQKFIEKAFENYFSTPGRVLFELNELAEMLKIEPKAAQIINTILDQDKSQKAIKIFKWLILINKLLMDFVIESSILFAILQKIECVEENEFDQLLNKKLINPYKLYLMKRCQFLPKKSQNIDKMYQLMNLIQSATSFSEIIYTLGRYYSKVYPFAADFNIVLGNDLNTVYNQMVKYTPKPPPIEILSEFQKIHQKMYIIYYNCYYYKYLKPFVPRWVVTDILSPDHKSSKIQSPAAFSSNKSLEDTFDSSSMKKSLKKITDCRKINLATTSEFDMTQSAVFQISPSKSKKFEESLMLLKSMERVFEELQDF